MVVINKVKVKKGQGTYSNPSSYENPKPLPSTGATARGKKTYEEQQSMSNVVAEILSPVKSPVKSTPLSQKVSDIMGTLPPNPKTEGFTQEMLDEAQSQGIDVFEHHNLQKISKLEQGAQANLSAQEQALTSFLQGQQPAELGQTQTGEGVLGSVGADIGRIEGQTALGALTGPSRIPNPIRGAVAVLGAAGIVGSVTGAGALTFALKGTVSKLLVGGAVVGAPLKLIKDAKQALAGTVTSLDLVIEGAKLGVLSPEQAAVELANIQDQMNSLERSINSWSKLSLLNYIGGGQDVRVDIANAKRDYEIKRQLLIQAIAQGAIA